MYNLTTNNDQIEAKKKSNNKILMSIDISFIHGLNKKSMKRFIPNREQDNIFSFPGKEYC